ncbi:MAG: hypothetical protein EOP04_24790 [Proteobacteria bacterium]|nr:MAG: hypothetical protein EOP04_24790 [Pseudomonadota bacterium]
MFQAFDFKRESEQVSEIAQYVRKQGSSFLGDSISWIETLERQIAVIRETGEKFHEWIRQQLLLPLSIDENIQLQERVKRAAQHFGKELSVSLAHLQACSISTDNRGHAREINDNVRELFGSFSLRHHMLQGFSVEIDLDAWQQKKRSFQSPSFSVNVYGGTAEAKKGLVHPALYWQLKQLRDSISARKEQPLYLIASSKTLEELVTFLPQTEEELEQISGFGKVKIRTYGSDFLELIRSYCEENGLSSQLPERKVSTSKKVFAKEKAVKPPAEGKTNTKAESYKMFREGRSISEIAAIRGFTEQTIQGHLAHYIQMGEIAISELVPDPVVILINDAISKIEMPSLGAVKAIVGDAASFGDIRLVMAANNYRQGMG